MSEKDFGVQHLCDVFVVGEFSSVVSSDGKDKPFERSQKLYDETGYGLCVLAFCGLMDILCGGIFWNARKYILLQIKSFIC